MRAGFLRLVYGGAHEGDHLCRHPTVDAVHLTGSHATFRALVGGPDPGDGRPPLGKPVTSELGNVSPVVVVPGPWSEREVPWPLDAEMSVAIGFIFLGNAFYFLYAVLRPRWDTARAQLWSFFAYDVVLLGPLLAH